MTARQDVGQTTLLREGLSSGPSVLGQRTCPKVSGTVVRQVQFRQWPAERDDLPFADYSAFGRAPN